MHTCIVGLYSFQIDERSVGLKRKGRRLVLQVALLDEEKRRVSLTDHERLWLLMKSSADLHIEYSNTMVRVRYCCELKLG